MEPYEQGLRASSSHAVSCLKIQADFFQPVMRAHVDEPETWQPSVREVYFCGASNLCFHFRRSSFPQASTFTWSVQFLHVHASTPYPFAYYPSLLVAVAALSPPNPYLAARRHNVHLS